MRWKPSSPSCVVIMLRLTRRRPLDKVNSEVIVPDVATRIYDIHILFSFVYISPHRSIGPTYRVKRVLHAQTRIDK